MENCNEGDPKTESVKDRREAEQGKVAERGETSSHAARESRTAPRPPPLSVSEG